MPPVAEHARERLAAALRELDERPGPTALAGLRAAADALIASHAALEATLDARDEQVAAQRAVILNIGCPILQVRSDVLCAPLIGDLDSDRAALLSQNLLALAAARSVRYAIVDLTGAVIHDPWTAALLTRVLAALRLVGVRGMLCGLRPELARMLASVAEVRFDAPCFIDLAGALAACQEQPARARP